MTHSEVQLPLCCLQFTPTTVKLGGNCRQHSERSCTGGLEEPACTKLMGNCSVWLLPSLEQGLEGGSGGRRSTRWEAAQGEPNTPH